MKKIKNIFFVCIFSLIMGAQAIVASAAELSELQSGIYEISNDVYHEQEIGMNMARTYVDENMTLEKSEGKWYYTVKFSGTNYMENHRISINDELVDTEVVNENSEENTIELKFETDSITPDLEAQIYVDAMGRDVEFGIIPKEETLNLVQAIEEVVEVVEAESTENTNEETSNEEAEQKSEKSSNKSIFIGIGAVIAVAILVLVIRRVKK